MPKIKLMTPQEIERQCAEMWDAVYAIPHNDPGKYESVVEAAKIQAAMWERYRKDICLGHLRSKLNELLPIDFGNVEQISCFPNNESKVIYDAIKLVERL